MRNRTLVLTFCAGAALTFAGCGPEVEDHEGAGPGGSLTRNLNLSDLNTVVSTMIEDMFKNHRVLMIADHPTIAFNGMENKTTHTLMTDPIFQVMEKALLDNGTFAVVDESRRNAFLDAVAAGMGDAYDPEKAPQAGRQMGIRYYLYGIASEVAEKNRDTARSQYTVTMKLTDVESGEVVWSNFWQKTKTLQ